MRVVSLVLVLFVRYSNGESFELNVKLYFLLGVTSSINWDNVILRRTCAFNVNFKSRETLFVQSSTLLFTIDGNQVPFLILQRMDVKLYDEKVRELQSYLPFLEDTIAKLATNPNAADRLNKFRKLHTLIDVTRRGQRYCVQIVQYFQCLANYGFFFALGMKFP